MGKSLKTILSLSILLLSLPLRADTNPVIIGVLAPTNNQDGTPIVNPLVYDLYGGRCSDPRPLPHLAGPQPDLTFPPRNPTVGQKHCYYLQATDTVTKLTSDPSIEIIHDLSPPAPPPSKPKPPTPFKVVP